MALNVAYFPGMFGSRLGVPPLLFNPEIDIWVSAFTVGTGLLLQLQLGPDGVSPGPLTHGTAWQALGILESAYGPLHTLMVQRGWNVLDCPFDWRMSVRVTAPLVWASIRQTFGSAPFVCVCHSMGGLVARAVYALMVQGGAAAQLQGIVTMGTPHFGSWATVRAWFGLEPFYTKIMSIAGIAGPYLPYYRPDFIDVICASWPGFYECLPWRDSGPLAIADPATAQALYQLQTYQGGNPYLQQQWFAAAVQTQHYLAPAIPPNQMPCVAGSGIATADEFNPPYPLSQLNGYAYTDQGDGVVPFSYATPPNQLTLTVPVPHGDQPLDWRSQRALVYAVQTLVGPGA